MASETEYRTLWGETAPLALTKPEESWAEKSRRQRERARELRHARTRAGNPLIREAGLGPDGATCGGCVHHLDLEYHGKHYHKCDKRTITHGSGSDIRVRWPACALYSPRPQDAK